MKAVIYTEYGTPAVLQVTEVEKPAPQDDEVLIKIQATAVNFADWALLTGSPFPIRLAEGFSKPKHPILGSDVAGQVEAVGKSVTQFQVGDRVFGDLSGEGRGGLAEYVCALESKIALIPDNVSYVHAAAVPMAAITALQGIRDAGEIKVGQKVLINGASGGVGSFAVQIAKAYDTEVTAVCSTGKMEMVRSIGADHAIDYTKENFTENGKRYDLIVGVNGYHPLGHYKRVLSPNGTYVCAGGTMPQIFQSMLLGPLLSLGGNKKLKSMGVAQPNQDDLKFMADLLAAGKVTPVIDACYPLDEAVEAFKQLGKKSAKGKIIITMEAEA